MTVLHQLLRNYLHQNGVLPLDVFMEIVLYHPQVGYYARSPVIGQPGDFVTAPEMTQVFGEVLAAWFIHQWQQAGAPLPVRLIELGPGRGTLMRDMLSVFKRFPELLQHTKVILYERSNFLRDSQQRLLAGSPIRWCNDLSQISADGYAMIIANEFFDALPFTQQAFVGGKWEARTLTEKEGAWNFTAYDCPIRESCEAYRPVLAQVKRLLTSVYGGAVLVIDYGDRTPAPLRQGDTLQAVWHHKRVPPLSFIGDADLTHHVDFFEVEQQLSPELTITFEDMGTFLKVYGLLERTDRLCQQIDSKTAHQLQTAAVRLTHAAHMGQLFKVLTGFYLPHALREH